MKNDATVKSLKRFVKSILNYKFITRLEKYLYFLDIKIAFSYCIKNKKFFIINDSITSTFACFC